MADGNDSGGSGSNSGQNTSGSGTRTFTEHDVDRIVRERLDRERRKQEDAARAAADAQKSDIDKLTAAVAELTKQAADSKAEIARRDVAEKYNLPKSFAGDLKATDPSDLDREARELVERLGALGVPVKDGKIAATQAGSNGAGGGQGNGNGGGGTGGNTNGSDGKGGNAGGGDGKNGGGQGSTGGDGADAGNNGTGTGSGQQDSGGDAGKGRSLLGGRPTETLRSGAAPAGGGSSDVDAGKLADSILTRGI